MVPRDLSSESKEESESTREGTSPVSQPNVLDDDGFPTYARLRKEHPYDKLKKCELKVVLGSSASLCFCTYF